MEANDKSFIREFTELMETVMCAWKFREETQSYDTQCGYWMDSHLASEKVCPGCGKAVFILKKLPKSV